MALPNQFAWSWQGPAFLAGYAVVAAVMWWRLRRQVILGIRV
jgi:hypothetical protein